MMHRVAMLPMLVLANLAVLASAALVGWNMTSAYRQAFHGFRAEAAQAALDQRISVELWERHTAAVGAVAQQIAAGQTLRRLVSARDSAGLPDALAEEWRRGAVSSGEVRLLGVTLYDASFEPLAARWANATEVVDPGMLGGARGREGQARLRSFTAAWLSDGKPRLSVIVPVGGLRLAGFVAVHVDPLPALAELDKGLSMSVRILPLQDGPALFTPTNLAVPAGPAAGAATLTLHGPDRTPLARVETVADLTALNASLTRIAERALLLFLGVSGIVAALAVAGVWMAMQRARRATAAAAAALAEQRAEAARLAAAEADARREAEQTGARARADMTAHLVARMEGLVRHTVEGVQRKAAALAAATEQLSGSIDAASGTAAEVGATCATAHAEAEQVARSCETSAARVAEMAARCAAAAEGASGAAMRAEAASDGVQRLALASAEIGRVLDLIADIAKRTTLLALNATIEAARAGETGKGFAVVAVEVKALAAQTAEATGEIGARIGAIRDSTAEAVASLSAIRADMAMIDSALGEISGAVQAQAETVRGIAGAAVAAAGGTARAQAGMRALGGQMVESHDSLVHATQGLESLRGEIAALDQGVGHLVAELRAA